MKTVIGLFWDDENIQSSIHKLRQAGCAEDTINVLTRVGAVRKLLDGGRGQMVAKCAVCGALLGSITYGAFGLSVGMGSFSLFNNGLALGIARLLPFFGIGAAFGAFMGCFVGVGEGEESTHLYCQGVRMGGKLVVVQANDELAAKAINTLCQEDAIGVTALNGTQDGRLSP
jgi:hypothetical protein